jgi:hypothetical protein
MSIAASVDCGSAFPEWRIGAFSVILNSGVRDLDRRGKIDVQNINRECVHECDKKSG